MQVHAKCKMNDTPKVIVTYAVEKFFGWMRQTVDCCFLHYSVSMMRILENDEETDATTIFNGLLYNQKHTVRTEHQPFKSI